jgi:hypothetical protein
MKEGQRAPNQVRAHIARTEPEIVEARRRGRTKLPHHQRQPARREKPTPRGRRSVRGAHGHIEGRIAQDRGWPMTRSEQQVNRGRAETLPPKDCLTNRCSQGLGLARNRQAEQRRALRRCLHRLAARPLTPVGNSRSPIGSSADEPPDHEGPPTTLRAQPAAKPHRQNTRDHRGRVRGMRPRRGDGWSLPRPRGRA